MTACPVGIDGRCPTCQRAAGRVWDTATAAGHVLAQAQTRRVPPVRVWPCSCGEMVAGPTRHDAGHAHMTVVAVPLIVSGHGLPEYAAPVVLALYTDGWHLDDALAAAADTATRSPLDQVREAVDAGTSTPHTPPRTRSRLPDDDSDQGVNLRAQFLAEGRTLYSELDEDGDVVVRGLAGDGEDRSGTGLAPGDSEAGGSPGGVDA